MKLATVREAYYGYSGKLSDIVRQLSFAGIGVFWILRIGKDVGTFKFDPQMVHGLSAFVFALMMDLLHYISATAIWGVYGRWLEKHCKIDEASEFGAPPWINWPANLFFWAKTLCCILGMYSLLHYLGKQF
jgi:hypothetical protein